MQWFEPLSLFYLAAINLAALTLFGIDKLFAIRKHCRIPESHLLLLTLLGGSAGALVGMVVFHHKISKPKFRYTVPFIFVVYLILLLAYLIQTAYGIII